MTHVHQVTDWLNAIEEFQSYPAWKRLNKDSRFLLEGLQGRLMLSPIDKRANVVGPFSYVIKKLLERRGLKPDPRVASVKLNETLSRSADVSFSVRTKRWIIEIKTGLEFNSLGAAVLEGMAFKKQEPKSTVVLLCLYAKASRSDLLDTLKFCDVTHAIDRVFILTQNAEYKLGATYFDNWADNLNAFVDALPSAKTIT